MKKMRLFLIHNNKVFKISYFYIFKKHHYIKLNKNFLTIKIPFKTFLINIYLPSVFLYPKYYAFEILICLFSFINLIYYL